MKASQASSPWSHLHHNRTASLYCHHHRRQYPSTIIIFFIAIVVQQSIIAAASLRSKGYTTEPPLRTTAKTASTQHRRTGSAIDDFPSSSKKKNKKENKKKFQWSQSVNPMTGIASSLETSSSSFIAHDDDDSAVTSTFHTRLDSSSIAKDLFECYPRFISRWDVTFGLCSTRRRRKSQNNGTRNNHGDNDDYVIDLYNPLLRTKFLTFGTVRHHHRRLRLHSQQQSISVTEIPILGGLLLHHQHRQDQLSSKDRRRQSFGILRFEMVHNIIQQKLPSSSPSCSLSSNDGNRQCQTTVITHKLKTEIVGYRPSLIGDRLPANPLQMGLYRYTQRLAHAYVMSRYHKYVLEEIERKMSEN